MMRSKTKIISMLLAIIMLFSLIPFNVFAEGGNNGEVGGDGGGKGINSHYTGSIKYLSTFGYGYRFSLYFLSGGTEQDLQNGSKEFVQIGKTVDVLMSNSSSITKSTIQSVFDYMHNEKNVTEMFYAQDANCANKSEISCLSKQPISDLLDTYVSNGVIKYSKNYEVTALNKFFMGVEKYDKTNPAGDSILNFENTTQIANYIISTQSDYQQLNVNDFRDGTIMYRDKQEKGVFKLFYEPFFGYDINGTKVALTYRDAIAYNNLYPDLKLWSQQGSTFPLLANRVYLSGNEPYINMKGNTSNFQFPSDSTVYQSLKDNSVKGKPGYDSMGVGVVTGGIYRPVPDLIKTFVEIESVDSNGNIKYKKAAETTIDKADFILDSNGNMTQVPIVQFLENEKEGYVGLLNDIITVDEDLTISEASEWTNTNLPTNVGVELKADASDIAGYTTGLVTNTEFFVDQVRKEIKVSASAPQIIMKAMSKSLDDFQYINTSSVSGYENYYFGSIGKTDGLIYADLVNIRNSKYYEKISDIKLGKLTSEGVEKEEKSPDKTPANNIILRYVVKPNPSQVNIIEVYNEATNETTYVSGGIQTLQIDGSTATVQDPSVDGLKDIGTPELVEWVTNSEYPLIDISNGTLPSKSVSQKKQSENGLSGSSKTISNYPQEPVIHNLYVKWKVVIKKAEVNEHGKYFVEEWRLSKYFGKDTIEDGSAMMSLPITYGCCGLATLSPSGNYNYTTKNPNGSLTQSNHSNMKLYSWLHSETVNTGAKASVSAYQPTAVVTVDGVINAIKSSDTSGLKVAKWLDKDSINGLTSYDIASAAKGEKFNQAEYNKEAVLNFNLYNLDTYTNGWPSSHAHYNKNRDYIGHCHRWVNSKSISPNGASYTAYSLPILVEYARFNALETGASKVFKSDVKEENGKTTIAYQTNTTLNVYPEIAMLFDNDSDSSSIKWAVGEQARAITPMVFHSLQYKVWVMPLSNGTSVATDSRATAKARSLGYANRQVIYKGSAVNSSFGITRAANNGNEGILTLKTYALDISSNKNGVNLKSEWGASSYNTENLHNTFRSKWGFNKTTANEWLEIGDGYVGDKKEQTIGLSAIKYSGNEVTEFTHELIIRGGKVVGVKLQDRNNKTYSSVSIETLKTKDEGLYEALVGMKLIGAETVLSNFSHKVGASLTESKYKTMVASAKEKLDGIKTDNIEVGKGWYSEDSTALVIKEYITNYKVPSIGFTDKISLTVKGLETPVNKDSFFSQMQLGHTALMYTVKASELNTLKNDLSSAKVFFEHHSKEADSFGGRTVEYLVPNVSITDTTR